MLGSRALRRAGADLWIAPAPEHALARPFRPIPVVSAPASPPRTPQRGAHARSARSGAARCHDVAPWSGVLEARHVRPLVGEQECLDGNVLVDVGL